MNNQNITATEAAVGCRKKLGVSDAEAIKAALLAQVSSGAFQRASLTELASELVEAFAAIDVATSALPAGE